MKPALSAGILLYRYRDGLEILLAHPGGPFWARRDLEAWTVPKGEIGEGEEPEDAARRELREETGIHIEGPMTPLGEVRQKAGKRVIAWAAPCDIDAGSITSNRVRMEWPRGSGRTIEFPEIDRCEWFSIEDARRRINPAQIPLLDRLVEFLAG